MKSCTLTIQVHYDPGVTDPEAIAAAADSLLKTALAQIPMDEYGDPVFGEFYVQGEGEQPKQEGRMQTVEYFRCWAGNGGDSGTWDTDFIEIPADTPDDVASLNNAVRVAASKLKWRKEPPVFTGFYAYSDSLDDEE